MALDAIPASALRLTTTIDGTDHEDRRDRDRDARMIKGSRRSLALMAAGPLAFYAIFVLLPLAQSLQISTWSWNGLGEPVFIGLDNYTRALSDPLFLGAFRNTAVWLVVAVTVPTVLGLLLAVLLDRPLRASRVYKSAFYMPITLSLVVVGQVWT